LAKPHNRAVRLTPKTPTTATGAKPEDSSVAARPALERGELEALARARPPRLLRSGPGRETFPWQLASGARVIVKRYHGRAPREAWRALLGGSPRRSAGALEYDNLLALASLGLPVPRALARHEEGPLSLVVMEELEHLETLRERLAAHPGQARGFLEPVFEVVERLHGAGWYHRDLYLDHFLVLPGGAGLALIDVGRARRAVAPRLRWFVKDLAALLHSSPASLRGPLTLRFLCRWLDGRGLFEPAVRRRIARAVLRKERRMAAHRPRGGTSYPSPARGRAACR
jgi:tRNA A-37 threonylcarbamoyl transferase component Bud32